MKNVIILEDDFHMAQLMKEKINELADYQCDSIYANPVDFFENPNAAAIFLLDIVMPKMNGLEAIKKILALYPDTNIIIYGHTDSTGDENYNMNLSVARAESVKNYLASRGLVRSRFDIVGMGETEPMDSNETASGRANNRRVEFAILANNKMIEEAEKQAE